MNGFLRTFLIGMGLLGLLTASIALTTLFLLKQRGVLPQVLRDYALSPSERAAIERLHAEPLEDASVVRDRDVELEDTVRRIADLANEATARELIERLNTREQVLAERTALLDRRESELRLARAELERLRRHQQDRRAEIEVMIKQLDRQVGEWADAKIREAERLRSFSEVEQERLRELAVMYQSSRSPWAQLKVLDDPDRIARILLFMEPKKAAKVMDAAIADPAYQEMPRALHHAMVALDKDGVTGDHSQRLADLYQLMKPDQVLGYLVDSEDREIAAIMTRMGDAKKRAGLMSALSDSDPARGAAISRLLERGVEAQQ
ncbi:MAG: MotE family protein [Planctomycetota bacterium]